MRDIDIIKYDEDLKSPWDDFISNSKNGVFLHYRDYMEYHSGRFQDLSLLFFSGTQPIAVMPANIEENTLYSHAGLTFGGIISNETMSASMMLMIFDKLRSYLAKNGITRIVYKATPYIYHNAPADEDLYALFRNNAELMRRDVSSTIFRDRRINPTKDKNRSIKRSKSHGLVISQSQDYASFMGIVEENLRSRHKARPTHNAAEMKLLAERFPDHIKLFAVYKERNMLGGAIVYESNQCVAHAQYIASTDEGRRLHSTDFLVDHLVNHEYADRRYFDFGISTENEGRFLNEGLSSYKEEFGARSVAYDTYRLQIERP
jgi:hypothetical protein